MLDSCIFCNERAYYGNSNEVKLERTSQQANLRRFFQQLERYLDDIPLAGGDKASQECKTRHRVPFQQILSAGVGACDRCFTVVVSFCDLYHQIKSTELLLNWKVQTLANLMNGEASAPTGKKNASLEADDEDHLLLDFKREVVRKCSLKLQNTFPRVSTKDIGKDISALGWNSYLVSSDKEINSGLTDVTIKESSSLVDHNNDYQDLSDEDSDSKDNVNLKRAKLRTPAPTKIPKQIINPETGKHQCGVCEKEFKDVSGYRNHYQSAHLEIRFECPICGKSFTRQGSYKRHHRTVHLEEPYRRRNVTTASPKILVHCARDNLEEAIKVKVEPPGPDKNVSLRDTDIKIENPPTSPDDSESDEANANGVPSCDNLQSERLNDSIPNVAKCSGSKTSNGIPPSSINPETGKNRCSACFKEFNRKTDYRIHYRSTHLRIRYACKICGKVFSLQSSYRKHHRNIHVGVGFQCNQCNKQFKCRRRLAAHQRSQCGKPALELVDSAHDPVTGKHKCSFCGRLFMSEANYRTHYRSVHLGVRFKCHICSKLFGSRYALKLHQHCKHAGLAKGPTPKPLLKLHVCEHCGKGFRINFHLQAHIKAVHLNIKVRDHVCDMCGKAFATNCNLQMHINSVHLKLREHICDICGKGYTTPMVLHNHVMSVHQKYRRYTCNLCKRKFSDKRRLIVHRCKHHQEENTIKESSSLVDHNNVYRDLSDDDPASEGTLNPTAKLRAPASTKIPKQIINPKTGKHQCGACDKGFKHLAGYRNHYQSAHLKIRFECPICGKGFTRQGSYKRHHGSAHLVDGFQCIRCNQQFTNKKYLGAHQKQCCGQDVNESRSRKEVAVIPEILVNRAGSNLKKLIEGDVSPPVPDETVIFSKTGIKIANPPTSPDDAESEEANANELASCNNPQSERIINDGIPKGSKFAAENEAAYQHNKPDQL